MVDVDAFNMPGMEMPTRAITMTPTSNIPSIDWFPASLRGKLRETFEHPFYRYENNNVLILVGPDKIESTRACIAGCVGCMMCTTCFCFGFCITAHKLCTEKRWRNYNILALDKTGTNKCTAGLFQVRPTPGVCCSPTVEHHHMVISKILSEMFEHKNKEIITYDNVRFVMRSDVSKLESAWTNASGNPAAFFK